MQSTLVLDEGGNSLIKRSPSMRLLKESGEKLSSTFDFSSLQMGRTRRNSIPSSGQRGSESRGSVPILHVPQRISGRPISASHQNQTSKSRSLKLYQYLRGTNDQNSSSDMTKLEETLAAIKNQLDDLSAENRSVGKRVSMLTQDITNLCKKVPPAADNKTSPLKSLTIPNSRNHHNTRFRHLLQPAYNTLSACTSTSLPIQRAHSQPPLVQIDDSWDSRHSSISSESSDTPISQDSQEEFDLRVIHSTHMDNQHCVIVLTPPRGKDGHLNESPESSEGDEEDVFDDQTM